MVRQKLLNDSTQRETTSRSLQDQKHECRCLRAGSPGVPPLFLVKDLLQTRQAEQLNVKLPSLAEILFFLVVLKTSARCLVFAAHLFTHLK